MELTPNQQRLYDYAKHYTADGTWTHLGEDALPDAMILQQHGLVQICIPDTDNPTEGPTGPAYRLHPKNNPKSVEYAEYLNDLAERIFQIPVMHGVNQYDYEMLQEIANHLKTA